MNSSRASVGKLQGHSHHDSRNPGRAESHTLESKAQGHSANPLTRAHNGIDGPAPSDSIDAKGSLIDRLE